MTTTDPPVNRCPACGRQMPNPTATPCAICTTTDHTTTLCRHCGARVTLPADRDAGAHLQCRLNHRGQRP